MTLTSSNPFIWVDCSAGLNCRKLRPYYIVVILLLLPNPFSALPVDNVNDETEESEYIPDSNAKR